MLKSFALAWFITDFEPIKKLVSKIPVTNALIYLKQMLECIKCASFWVCLILSHNIFLAAATGLLASLYDYYVAPKIKLNN